LELNGSQVILTAGTVAEINLPELTTDNLEPIINSLKEVQLRGLVRIKQISELVKIGEV
jgi:hypothetical protein